MGRPRNCWSETVGAHGHQVTAYERTLNGPLWLRWWIPGANGKRGRYDYRALKHTDRAIALETARSIAGQLLSSTLAAATGRATLAEVLAIYDADVARHAKGDGPSEIRRRIACWTFFLGAEFDVNTLDFPSIDRYVRARRERKIVLADYPGLQKKEPSDRTIGADIEMLQAALNHATRVRRSNGQKLLLANPITGYPRLRNKNVRRPLATYDRFLAVRAVANDVDPQRLFRSFMDMIEGLGWRVSAVCQLRACDVDRRRDELAPFGRLHKFGEFDKEGADAWVPMAESVRAAIDDVLTINPAIGEWPLFPSPRAKTAAPLGAGEIPKPWRKDHARDLLERAEVKAKLEPLKGSDFHAYRRKWATERKHLPTADVAKAGQWRDLRTLETAYIQADDATILQVVLEPRKLRDRQKDAG